MISILELLIGNESIPPFKIKGTRLFLNGKAIGTVYLSKKSFGDETHLDLVEISIDKDHRGNKYFTRFINALGKYADANEYIVSLTPEAKEGGDLSTSELKRQYIKAGYVLNKGKHKNFYASNSYVRYPKNSLSENKQQFEKAFVNTGYFDDEDVKNVLDITNGDESTYHIADMYAYYTNRLPYTFNDGKRGEYLKGIKDILVQTHLLLKQYKGNKNLFPIKGFNIQSTKEHITDIKDALEARNYAINVFKRIPEKYRRNIKNIYREPIPIEAYSSNNNVRKDNIRQIKHFLDLVDKLNNYEKQEIILNKVFSSKNDTMEKLLHHIETARPNYLNHDNEQKAFLEMVEYEQGYGEAELLYNENDVVVVKVSSSDAMKNLGCGSQWCFTTERGTEHWGYYAANSYVTLVVNFNELPDSYERMVVVLPIGEMYNMYNEYMEDGDDYLNKLGVSKYVNGLKESLLNEGATDILYHFTNFYALDNILSSNELNATFAGASDSDLNKNAGKYFFLSTTRSGHPDAGYSGRVRIEIDGRKLSTNHKVKPIDYWNWSMNRNDYDDATSYNSALRSKEMEDRVFLDKTKIENAHKYITAIDVLISHKVSRKQVSEVFRNARRLKIPLYWFDDESDFKNQKRDKAINPIKSKQYVEKDPYGEMPTRGNIILRMAEMIAVMSLNRRNIVDTISSNYKLSPEENDKLIRTVNHHVDRIKRAWSPTDVINPIKADLHNNRRDPNLGKFFKILVQDIKSIGATTLNDYLEKILNVTNETLLEAPETFDYNKFKDLSSYRKKLEYAKEQLGNRIGAGSSRVVFKIDDDKVLKLAKNRKGVAQNEVETQWAGDYYFENLLAKVFDYDKENNYWVVMELAKKAKKSDFKRLWGIDFNVMERYLTNIYSQNNGRRGKYSIDSEEEQKLIDSQEVSDVIEFMHSMGAPAGDFGKISSWGIVDRGGEDLVLIDYGLDGSVYSGYYS